MNFMQRGKRLGLCMVGAAGLLVGSQVMADEYAMSYSAQELGSQEGVKSVHARIVRTAKQYCPSYSEIRSAREVQTCVDDVVGDLVDKVDHPRLSTYHYGDSGVRVAKSERARDDEQG